MLASHKEYEFSLLLAGLAAVAAGGCVAKLEQPDGTCRVTDSPLLDCTVDSLGDEISNRKGVPPLGAYACTGSARPDDSPTITEGVPEGRICTDKGMLGDTNERGYCCTEYDTACAYNPLGNCPEDRDGYQCRGAYRPETYNPTIYCDQATENGDLLEYCCSKESKMSGSCIATAGCPLNLFAWTCKDPKDLPRAQELLASKSRSDTYYMTCSIPQVNPNGTLFYCCFVPGIMPPGGTCTQHTTVPGCDSGRFGFSCLGPDTPEDNFPPMVCPDPGVPGISMEGYAATLYCCDFVSRTK